MPAPVRIVEEIPTAETLAAYGQVSIAFRVESQFRVELLDGGLGGVRLVEEPVHSPYAKDYDTDVGPGDEPPLRWLRWISPRSSLFVAYEGERRLGGACVFSHVEEMEFLRHRLDTAALWDIRVAPDARGRGVGTALFRAAVDWCKRSGYQRLKIETQNINVAACRFYAEQGCYLGGIEIHAYEAYPNEVELIWYYDL
jgi:GNAT superfamily N-acetyltransferase